MKKCFVVSVAIYLMLCGCARTSEVSPVATDVRSSRSDQDAVAVVEQYFRAVEQGKRDEAEILLSKLTERRRNVKVEEIDVNRLRAVQSTHFDWFTYFRDEGFKLERASNLGRDMSRFEIRAFCTSPAGYDTIPQVVDFQLIMQDGRIVIHNLSPNITESLREAKKTRPS